MTISPFDLTAVHPSWKKPIQEGLALIDPDYLKQLIQTPDWLPGFNKLFSAFSLGINDVNYVLFGESPYPRSASANGYAFWDAAVRDLWSSTGLSTSVNRATSLRNMIKMLLVAEGKLHPSETTQEFISKIDKQHLVQSNNELFSNFLAHGFLLLNASPVLLLNRPHQDAKAWLPFTSHILTTLLEKNLRVKFILLGNIAKTVNTLIPHSHVDKLVAEHPYNISFITNPEVLAFFKPLYLLRQNHP